MKKKRALITGITGQDGSYLCEFLLNKNYEVFGTRRRSSLINTQRIDHLINQKKSPKIFYADLVDSVSMSHILKEVRPDEIYNLAAQSHVKVSFEIPIYTASADALGVLNLLESIKLLGLKSKFYQASTSEMYGNSKRIINENTEFQPVSPYGASKLFAHNIVKIYREAFNIFAVSGILFNHESHRRGEAFVTRKITLSLAQIAFNKLDVLKLGNLNAIRDWGHAKDYVSAMWMMLQRKKPEDFIIATGKSFSIKDFCNLCLKIIGVNVKWHGINEHEYAVIVSNSSQFKNLKVGKKIIIVDKNYYRPLELNTLKVNPKKSMRLLKWKPKIDITNLAKEMIYKDLNRVKSGYFQDNIYS
jgi:GDPmannose 4,6-dehydratase